MPAFKADGRETRATIAGAELRFAQNENAKTRVASGYAALFNSPTDIGGCWTEVIAPGAFRRSLAEFDCLAVHSHDTGRVVGRKDSGTLTLREDETGLYFENSLPDTTDGRDLIVQLERKDIVGMSFGFVARREEWDETAEPPRRTILEARLYEITYTPCPAYPDTSVGLRSLEGARTERREHNKAGATGRIIARRMKLAHTERKI